MVEAGMTDLREFSSYQPLPLSLRRYIKIKTWRDNQVTVLKECGLKRHKNWISLCGQFRRIVGTTRISWIEKKTERMTNSNEKSKI